jgi:signal transduction histidine kinase
VPDEQPILLSALPPTRRQERTALGVAAILLIVFLATIPFMQILLPPVQPFIPIVDTALFFNDSITAALLYAQFFVVRSRALLALASGYLLAASIIVPHALTFPGAFSETGLLGAGLQSTVWLYIFWHLALTPMVIAYALLKDRSERTRFISDSAGWAIAVSVACVFGFVCALTWLVTAGAELVPAIMVDAQHASDVWHYYAAPPIIVLFLISLTLLFVRRSSMLDLWLLVVLWAWFIETLLLSVTAYRFSVVWYVGRGFGLLSSCFVLIVLLSESTLLYARLAISVAARNREREGRLMSMNALAASIAHEMNQPLGAILNNSETSLALLDKAPVDLDEVRSALKDIIADVLRSGEIVGSIKSTFQPEEEIKTSVDINEVIRDTVAILQAELQMQRVLVELNLSTSIPKIHAHRAHLQQVVLNLSTNAIDAMVAAKSPVRLLSIESRPDVDGGVLVSVVDTGPGIDAQLAGQVFDPFFTTKAEGTGLGLAISRSLIASHHGHLWLAEDRTRGCAFHFSLPAGKPA